MLQVPIKHIADPTLHSMPAVTKTANDKWMLCQNLDNQITCYSAADRFKLNPKKVFKVCASLRSSPLPHPYPPAVLSMADGVILELAPLFLLSLRVTSPRATRVCRASRPTATT